MKGFFRRLELPCSFHLETKLLYRWRGGKSPFPRPFFSRVRCNLPNCRDSRLTKKPRQIFERSSYCTFIALSFASAVVNFTPLVPFSQVFSRLNKTIEEMGKRRIKFLVFCIFTSVQFFLLSVLVIRTESSEMLRNFWNIWKKLQVSKQAFSGILMKLEIRKSVEVLQ